MATTGKVFKGWPQSAALWNPWVGTGSFNKYGGVPLGVDLRTGGLVVFDPWTLKTKGLIDSTIFEVNGSKGYGKTTLLTSLTGRLMRLQAGHTDGVPNVMHTRIDSRKLENGKPEYGPLTEYLESVVHPLNRAASINLFDPNMGMTELDLVEVAVNVCETAKGSALIGFEPLALQVGISKMLRAERDKRSLAAPEVLETILGTLTICDVTDYFKDRAERTITRLTEQLETRGDEAEQVRLSEQLKLQFEQPRNVPEHEFQSAAAHVAGYLNRILQGDFGSIFGGMGSLRDILAEPMVTLDWTGVNEQARTLLESLLYKWNVVALQNNDLELIPHIRIGDEEHEAFKNLMHVRFYSEYVKKGRAFHTADFRSTQYETDLLMSDEGSEINRLAQGILRGFGGRFVTRQPKDDEILHRLTQHGLSDLDAHYLTEIEVGCFGIILPGRPMILYRHCLNRLEWPLVESDAAAKRMVDRIPVTSVPSMLERARQIGLVQVGMN